MTNQFKWWEIYFSVIYDLECSSFVNSVFRCIQFVTRRHPDNHHNNRRNLFHVSELQRFVIIQHVRVTRSLTLCPKR